MSKGNFDILAFLTFWHFRHFGILECGHSGHLDMAADRAVTRISWHVSWSWRQRRGASRSSIPMSRSSIPTIRSSILAWRNNPVVAL